MDGHTAQEQARLAHAKDHIIFHCHEGFLVRPTVSTPPASEPCGHRRPQQDFAPREYVVDH